MRLGCKTLLPELFLTATITGSVRAHPNEKGGKNTYSQASQLTRGNWLFRATASGKLDFTTHSSVLN